MALSKEVLDTIAFSKQNGFDKLNLAPPEETRKAMAKDAEGNIEIITNKRLMMMNVGAHFQHEELVLSEGGVLTFIVLNCQLLE